MGVFEYLKNPDEIYRESLARVQAATSLARIPQGLHAMCLRMVHACAMPDIVDDFAWYGDVAASARQALAQGAPIFCDCHMVRKGIITQRLPTNNVLICTLDDPRTKALSRQLQTTRSAAAVELWKPRLSGAVVVIGNAPTALFRLLEIIDDDQLRPSAIFGFPVGFVGASESKQALIEARHDIPFATLKGRRGGSAIAAAACNAVNIETLR